VKAVMNENYIYIHTYIHILVTFRLMLLECSSLLSENGVCNETNEQRHILDEKGQVDTNNAAVV
jgi:hypothetical protein